MQTLYRRYRPQTFGALVAQHHVKTTLMQEIISGNVGHAFLFTGPRGVGKTTTARLLAKALECVSRKNSAEPCNECESCKAIHEGRHIDVIEIDAASHTGVDNVRENIIDSTRVKPSLSSYKIFIIDEVHMLSGSAFNALLKTIEEPPAHVIFILATTETHKVPATIISRCQKFDFRHLTNNDIIARLKQLSEHEGKKVEDSVLAHVAWRAGGSMRDAESILSQILTLNEINITEENASQIISPRQNSEIIEYLDASLSGKLSDAYNIIKILVERGISVPYLMDECIDVCRALLLLKTTGTIGESFFMEQDIAALTTMSSSYDTTAIFRMLEILLKRRGSIGSSPILHLPLELTAVEMSMKTENTTIQTETHSTRISSKITTQKNDAKKISNNTNPTGLTGNIPTIEAVKENWQKFLEHIHTYNHSLPFILKTCTPLRMENTTLIVSVPYSFHKKRMEEPKVSSLIAKALCDIYQSSITILGEVDESKNQEADDAVAKVLETFGGEVVN